MQKDGWAKYIQNLLLNDANMIKEHQETKMKMPNMCLSLAETANRADSGQLQIWSEPSDILNF